MAPTPSRQEIIAQYRANISQGKRSKLSKADRGSLIDYFIIDLKNCETEDEVRQRCQQEITLLEEGYPTASVAAQYLPQWRKAIEQAVEDGNLPHQELPLTEHGRRYPHWALFHLRYDNAIYQAINEDVAKANNKRQDNLQPVHPHRFIQTAVNLLDSEDFRDVAAGLLALTGRRFSEIIAKGTFEPTTHSHALHFTGQLKKKSEKPETYTIATLCDIKRILKAITQFRSHKRIKALVMLDPAAINSRINSSIRERIQQAFQTDIVPILDGEESVSAHNLRGVYAAVAIYLWCPPNQATHRFIQAHLGHVIGESELERRKNSGATQHYFHYYMVGNHHQVLNQRGYMLGQYPPLTKAMPIPKPQPVTDADPAPATELLSVDNAVVDSVQGQPPDEDPTPHPMAQRLSDRSIAPFTQMIEWLQAKLDEAHSEIRELRAQSPSLPDTGELAQLRSENQRLLTENERLQAELEQFNKLKEIMGIDTNGHSPESPPEEESTEISRGRQPMAQRLSDRSIAVPDNEHNLGAIAPPPPSSTHLNTTENRAISAIIKHNNQPGLTHEAKWYLSIPVLSDLIRSSGATTSQKPLRAALDARKEEIAHHHSQHGLGVRHNVKHGQAGRLIGEIIALEH